MRQGRPRIQGSLEPKGGLLSPAVGAYSFGRGKREHIFTGLQVWQVSPVITTVVLTEGTTAPFMNRWSLGLVDDASVRAAGVSAKDLAVQLHGSPLGTTHALFLTPPDELLLLAERLFELPASRWAARRLEDAKRVQESLFSWKHDLPWESYGVLVSEVLDEIQRHLLCTPDGGVTWDLWTSAEVLGRLNERLKRFYLETGLIREVTTVPYGTSGEVELPPMLRVVRARVVGEAMPLQPTDQLQADLLTPTWETVAGTPTRYIQDLSPTRGELQLVPVPATAGSLVVDYIPVPETLSRDSVLPIPNLFTVGLKWGVIADLLSREGEANDPVRAKYAEQRYQLGVGLARVLLGVS